MKNLKTGFKFILCALLAIAAFHVGEAMPIIQVGGISLATVTFTPVLFEGTRFSEFFSEVIISNKTVNKKLVRFIDNIKYREIISTLSGSVALQAWTCDIPTPSGTINFGDSYIEPVKVMVYDEFCPDDLRKTSFSTDIPAGVANMTSNRWTQIMLNYVRAKVSEAAEAAFWNYYSNTFKTAVAAGGNAAFTTANEKTFVAARTGNAIGLDGLVAKHIFNTLAPADVPVNIVTGTVLSSANIVAELLKVYAAIPGVLLEEGSNLKIFAPYAVKGFLNVANQAALYRDVVTVTSNNGTMQEFSLFGIPIEFVPLGPNIMLAGNAMDYIWATDLLSDFGQVKIDKVANNAEKMFYRVDFAQAAAVVVPTQKVLYFNAA